MPTTRFIHTSILYFSAIGILGTPSTVLAKLPSVQNLFPVQATAALIFSSAFQNQTPTANQPNGPNVPPPSTPNAWSRIADKYKSLMAKDIQGNKNLIRWLFAFSLIFTLIVLPGTKYFLEAPIKLRWSITAGCFSLILGHIYITQDRILWFSSAKFEPYLITFQSFFLYLLITPIFFLVCQKLFSKIDSKQDKSWLRKSAAAHWRSPILWWMMIGFLSLLIPLLYGL